VSRFALDLYGALAADSQPSNLVFSPASIAIALAMAREGADGATAAQIDAVLPIDDRAALIQSVHGLTALDDTDLALAIVNSMFVQRGYEIGRHFVDTMRSRYDATPEIVDYAADSERARQRINAWVADATTQRITQLLPGGAVDRDTRLTLVNAIYMKARWRFPFPAAATGDADFTCADGAVRSVPTMRLVAGLPFAAGDGWRCVSLPYLPGRLSMQIVVPDAGMPMATAIAVAASIVTTDSARVAVSLPRFELETATSLVAPLRELGVVDAFQLDTADFSGITTTEPMCIGEVVHQANITVDEEGTEAAAATAFAMAGSGLPTEQPIDFRVDRPFVFAVSDRDTGTVLFLGHVADPT